ncbi:MAG: hypothetical protein ING19_02765 [Azospirillum sp.]|nr:hypothetical protein [Azospirillum sp.]
MITHVWNYSWATGWRAIVEKLIADVNALTGAHRVTMADLREKYGTLRVEFEPAPGATVPAEILAQIEALALAAENASEHVCITCGEPGHNYEWSGEFTRPLCPTHAREQAPRALDGAFEYPTDVWKMTPAFRLVDLDGNALSTERVAELDTRYTELKRIGDSEVPAHFGAAAWRAARWVSR